MKTTCPICQELGSTPTCRVCGHDGSKPVMVSDCCGVEMKRDINPITFEYVYLCNDCGHLCTPKPKASFTPLSNCHRAEIFYVQAQAFCSTCRNPCEGVEKAEPVPTPRTEAQLVRLHNFPSIDNNLVSASFARQLERELIAAQEAIARKDEALKMKLQLIRDTELDGRKCFCHDGTCWVCVAAKATSTH